MVVNVLSLLFFMETDYEIDSTEKLKKSKSDGFRLLAVCLTSVGLTVVISFQSN